MSIQNDAHVVVLLADYVGIDAAGKINALGAGFGIAPLQPTGLTAPMHVIVIVDVPAKHSGQQYVLSLELRDETTGQAVTIPAAPSGALEPLRIQQVVTVLTPQIAGLHLPAGSIPSRTQLPVAFQDGLPLQAGHTYLWKVQIDQQGRPSWVARFHVPGTPPNPVFGGPAGPASIPNIQPPALPLDENGDDLQP